MIAAFNQMLNPLRRAIAAAANRAVVHLVDDSSKTQLLQIEAREDEVREAVEHFQPAGFKSVPLAGSEAVVLAVGGNADHRVALAVHDKEARPTGWEPGEVGIFNLTTGDVIRLHADGTIDITATATVRITAPNVEIVGNLKVSGQISDAVGSMAQIRTTYNAHTHAAEGAAPPVPSMT